MRYLFFMLSLSHEHICQRFQGQQSPYPQYLGFLSPNLSSFKIFGLFNMFYSKLYDSSIFANSEETSFSREKKDRLTENGFTILSEKALNRQSIWYGSSRYICEKQWFLRDREQSEPYNCPRLVPKESFIEKLEKVLIGDMKDIKIHSIKLLEMKTTVMKNTKPL